MLSNRDVGTTAGLARMWTGPLSWAAGPRQASSAQARARCTRRSPGSPHPDESQRSHPYPKLPKTPLIGFRLSRKGLLLMALIPRRRSATVAALLGMSALVVTGLVATSPATAAPTPKASPSTLAAQSAAALVASKAAALHISKDDAFIAHKVISTP